MLAPQGPKERLKVSLLRPENIPTDTETTTTTSSSRLTINHQNKSSTPISGLTIARVHDNYAGPKFNRSAHNSKYSIDDEEDEEVDEDDEDDEEDINQGQDQGLLIVEDEYYSSSSSTSFDPEGEASLTSDTTSSAIDGHEEPEKVVGDRVGGLGDRIRENINHQHVLSLREDSTASINIDSVKQEQGKIDNYQEILGDSNNLILSEATSNSPGIANEINTSSSNLSDHDQKHHQQDQSSQDQTRAQAESPPIGPYQLRAFSSNTSLGSSNSSSCFISSLEQHQKQLNSLLDDVRSENKPIYSSLSSNLVNETLNYFVNCRQRLNQMTKTYDDTDAYILLLQEKEVDLELAARIGQDLLRQNKQLRESLQNVEKQLTERQEDIQQLKYDLASKSTLLETFIEEEQYQQQQQQDYDEHSQNINNNNNNNNNRSLTIDTYDDLRSSSQITNIISNNKLYYSSHSNNNNCNSPSTNHNNHHGHSRLGSTSSSIIQSSSSNHDFITANSSVIQESDENDFYNGNCNEEDELHNRPFYSLTPRLNNPPSQASTAEPFSSLPYNLTPGINSRFGSRSESTQPISRDDSSSCIFENNDVQCSQANHSQLQQTNQYQINQQHQQQQQRVKEQQILVDSVTFRLVESNKRLCELQDELLYKCEQNLMQQEKIFQLQEQLNDTDKKLCDMTAQNETLQQSLMHCEDSKRELSDELRVCKTNFTELLNVFLEMQRETRDLYLQNQIHQAHHHPNNDYDDPSRFMNTTMNSAEDEMSGKKEDLEDEDFEGYFQISTSASSTTATVYVVSSILLILLAKKSYAQLTYR